MKWQQVCWCRSLCRLLPLFGVVVVAIGGPAEGGVREEKAKRAPSTPEVRSAGITCSSDASELLFPLDGTYLPVNFCALPVTLGFDQAQCTGIPPDQHNDDDSSEIPLNFTFSLVWGSVYDTACQQQRSSIV